MCTKLILQFSLLTGLLTFSSKAWSQRKIILHPNCKIISITKFSHKEKKIQKTLFEVLKKNGYHPQSGEKASKHPLGILYVDTQKKLIGGGLYPKCEVKISIKRSRGDYFTSNDLAIFDESAKRQFPRVSRDGMSSRCPRALKDALAYVPVCETP